MFRLIKFKGVYCKYIILLLLSLFISKVKTYRKTKWSGLWENYYEPCLEIKSKKTNYILLQNKQNSISYNKYNENNKSKRNHFVKTKVKKNMLFIEIPILTHHYYNNKKSWRKLEKKKKCHDSFYSSIFVSQQINNNEKKEESTLKENNQLNETEKQDLEQNNDNKFTTNSIQINNNTKNNKKKNYKFTSWNNKNEINNFDVEKYDIINNGNDTHKYHSSFFTSIKNKKEKNENTHYLNFKINKELINTLSVEELLNVLAKYEDNKITSNILNGQSNNSKNTILNEVNIVTAYHRIAKHIKNKNYLLKENTKDNNEMDGFFDPITFSLFENYSNVMDEKGDEKTENLVTNNSITKEKTENLATNNLITKEKTENLATNNSIIKEKTFSNISYNNHSSLCNIDTYKNLYCLLKNKLVNNKSIVPKHIANIAWASTIILNDDIYIWNNIKKQFYENIQNFKAQEISIIVWSFSASKNKLIQNKKEFILLFNCIKKYIDENKFKAQEFSNIIWSVAVSKYANFDLLIILYNYALKIFEKLFMKDIATILYSLSIFATDTINQKIINTIKNRHFEKYGIKKDYLTIHKEGTQFDNDFKKNENNLTFTFSYFNKIPQNQDNIYVDNLIIEEIDNDDTSNLYNKLSDDKKYVFFLLFENFLIYSLKKIQNESEKMNMRIWANIFWSCANIGLGIYNDSYFNHNLKHYKYISINVDSQNDNRNYYIEEDNKIKYEKESSSMYTILTKNKLQNSNIEIDLKPYVHIIENNYVFPLKSDVESRYSNYLKTEMDGKQYGINVNLDIFNQNENVIVPFKLDKEEISNSITNYVLPTENEKHANPNNYINSNENMEHKNDKDEIDYSVFLKSLNLQKNDAIYNKTNKSTIVLKLVENFEYDLSNKIIKWTRCEIQSIANILWSLSILNIFSKKIFDDGLNECNKRFIKYGKRKNYNKIQYFISQLHQSQLYQVAFSYAIYLLNKKNIQNIQNVKNVKNIQNIQNIQNVKNVKNEKTITTIKQSLYNIFEKYFKISINTLNIWKKQLARNQRKEEKHHVSSSVHKKISADLKYLNVFHYNEYFILDSILVDAYIPHTMVAIEIDGPSHFIQRGGSIVYNPNTLFKKRLLRALGFVVVSISITEHTFIFSALTTINFVKRILAKINYNKI
ncbi:RAP protein, putative [Plasmodium berghei]|uniref:RAP protein, putative n=1 Tax=Plasmodium berghei TaxID=5821 RepID=A0A0Y9YQC8_PLABE|nr:RAP protein, putative [Plasmodium berghei]